LIQPSLLPYLLSVDTIDKTCSVIIIISLLMSPLLGHRPSLWITHKENGSKPSLRPSAGWWVLTTANPAGSNGLTCLPKHGGARDNIFLVTHPMTDQHCLTSAIARRSAVTAVPSSSSSKLAIYLVVSANSEACCHIYIIIIRISLVMFSLLECKPSL
jgi:hypothetical protein